jgi:hypothetical protein
VGRPVSGALRYVEWATAPILGVTTVFSYVHAEYGTAVVVGVCAGLVLGLQLGANWVRRTSD